MHLNIKTLIAIVLSLFILPLLALAQTATPSPVLRFTNTPLFPTATLPGIPFARPNINFGTTFSESFSDMPPLMVYHFEGETDQYVNILLEVETYYDTSLRLLDPNGFSLTSGGLNPTNTGLEIQAFRLQVSGLYSIVIENQRGLSQYSLRLRRPTFQTIKYGQVIEGQLQSPSYAALYQFSTGVGGWFDLSLTSSAFDVFVTLLDESLNEVSHDDDYGGDRNAFVGPYYLNENKNYFIHVRSKNDLSTGVFQLGLRRAEFIPLEYDMSVQINLNQNTPIAYYGFHGSIGDIVNIQVDSGGTIDTQLHVTTPQINLIPADDDSGSGFDPEIGPWVLEYTGQYGIIIRPYRIGDSGQVNLRLSRHPLLSLDDGPQEIRLSNKQRLTALTFTGEAGDHIQLLVHLDPVMVMTTFPLITISQNGQALVTAKTQDVSAFTVDFTIPGDGPVIIQVADMNGRTGVLQFSLERLPS